MEDHGFGVGVVEEVEKLLLHIAVVHVEGRAARLVGPQHALQVFVAVVHVEGDVILAGFPVLEGRALDSATETVSAQ